MSTIQSPRTASGYLFGPTERTRTRVPFPGSVAAVDRLSKAGRAVVADEISSLLSELIGVDLASVLAAAWRTHRKLAAAGERTASKPNAVECVDLTNHDVASVHKPTVEVIIDGVHVGTVRFELDLTFAVAGAVATVRNGRLVRVCVGRIDLTAVLSCEDVELARKHNRLQLPASLDFDPGPLLVSPSVFSRFGPVDEPTSMPSIRPAAEAVRHRPSA